MIKTAIRRLTNISAAGVLLATTSLHIVSVLLLPQTALATAGTGSTQDPYIITTCAELQALDNSNLDRAGGVIALGNDIDCSMTNPSDPDFSNSGTWADQQGFDPISNFQGTFDGKGHTIIGLYEHRMNGAWVGLFDYTPSMVTNLHIDSTSHFEGASWAGSIAGQSSWGSEEGVTSAATVTSTGGPVGGLIGVAYGDGIIFRHAAFTGTVSGSGSEVGGLIGQSQYGFDISDSYVNATITGGTTMGGIIGTAGYGNSCGSRVMANVYATGVINSAGSGYAGGLFGQFDASCNSYTKQIINTFSTMTKGTGNAVYGGIIGASSTNVQVANTYFDQFNMGTSSCIQSSSGTPDISTCSAVDVDGSDDGHFVDTTSVEPFAGQDGWNFEDTWQTAPGLPTLRTFSGLKGPHAVENLVLTPQAEAKVRINFDAIDDWGGMPEGYYVFQVKKSTESWDSNLIDDESIGNGTETTVYTNLPSTAIDVRVAAVSRYGRGSWTTLSTTTLAVPTHPIANCADLQAIDDHEGVGTMDTYVLTQNIDCTGVDFEPIGLDSNGWDESDFRGTLDGQGHTISHLTIDRPGNWEVGLFYQLSGATIRNLNLANGSVSGSGEVGSVAGYAQDGSSIRNVTSDLAVSSDDEYTGGLIGYTTSSEDGEIVIDHSAYNGDISGTQYVGGLIGYSESYSKATTISYSSATGTIGTTSGDAGGLIGYTDIENETQDTTNILTISNSFAHMGMETGGYTGGLIGEVYFYTYSAAHAQLKIDNAYAAGSISANDYASGLIGYVDGVDLNHAILVNNSFAAVSGIDNGPNYALIGNDNFVTVVDDDHRGTLAFTGTYFDQDLAGISTAAYHYTDGTTGITGHANYFLNNHANLPMSGWDFVDTWGIVEAGYPVLHPATDNDTDGSSSSVEQAAPHDGDANNDGYPDAYQQNVTSYVDDVTGHYAVVQTSCGANSNVVIGSEAGDGHGDVAFDYPAGLVDFYGVSCNSSDVTVTQYYYGNFDASKLVFRKWHNGVYTTVTNAVMTNETIGGQPVLKIVYHVVDGGPLDDDGTVNGAIHDPSGPAANVVTVPNTGLGGN